MAERVVAKRPPPAVATPEHPATAAPALPLGEPTEHLGPDLDRRVLEDTRAGKNAVVGQIVLGLLAALTACALSAAWNVFPSSSVPGMFFEPVQDGYVPMLPLLVVQLLWLGAAGASVVQAVRIGRLARWARVDEDGAPIPVWLAQSSRAVILALVSFSSLLLAWTWLF